MINVLSRLTEIGPPLTSEAISRFEQETKRPIPEPYKALLLRVNGGQLPRTATVFQYRLPTGRDVEGALRALLSIDASHEFRDLRRHLELYVVPARIPIDLYPVGTDYGGNLVLMGGGGPRLGRIYFWEHELEALEDEPPTERNIFFLAENLESFLEGLKPLLVLED